MNNVDEIIIELKKKGNILMQTLDNMKKYQDTLTENNRSMINKFILVSFCYFLSLILKV